MTTEHTMEYRAGLAGFGQADDMPHWRCTCGHWRINRNLITGSPVKATAHRKHREHVKDYGERAPGDTPVPLS